MSERDHIHQEVLGGKQSNFYGSIDNRMESQSCASDSADFRTGNADVSARKYFNKFMCSFPKVRWTQSTARITLILIPLSMLLFSASMYSSTKKDSKGRSNQRMTTVSEEENLIIPFKVVNRVNYDKNFENIYNRELFSSSFQTGKGNNQSDFVFPLPTGAFWINLVLEPTADRGFSYPIAVYPYAYKWSESLLSLSYPAVHRKIDSISIHDYFFPDLTFGIQEQVLKREITNFDPLSVTICWKTNNTLFEKANKKGGGSWETYLVQGSPYSTFKYEDVTPTIRALSIFSNVACPSFFDIFSSNATSKGTDNGGFRSNLTCMSKSEDRKVKMLSGEQFILQTQEGVTWIMFTSEPITLIYDVISRTTVTFSDSFDGIIRLAVIPTSNENFSFSSSTGLQHLIDHAEVYPIGGNISWEFHDPVSSAGYAMNIRDKHLKNRVDRVANLEFKFLTRNMYKNASIHKDSYEFDRLLMLALPHHVDLLPKTSKMLNSSQFNLEYKCIKGNMTAILGASWIYDEPLLAFDFDGEKSADELPIFGNSFIRGLLMENLEKDLKLALPTTSENVYGFGKQIARLAQLAHIADILNCTHNEPTIDKKMERIFDDAVGKLHHYLELFLTGNVSDYLVYDENFGGVVSIDGLLNDGADFGNGRYNDHHFHYGYILYASAVLGRMNSTFVIAYKDYVDAIFYDIAHKTNMMSQKFEGVFYPFARHMSWFDGHSFASGLFPFGNGKSQESSSEAVNAYYGAYLWSSVRDGVVQGSSLDISEMTDFARLLLAMEIRGAKKYWHMKTTNSDDETTNIRKFASSPYPEVFAKNFMVGNLGMLDAVCSTWFGTKKLYVHMINFLPVTGVTRELFSKDYVAQEYALFRDQPDVEMAWRGFVVSDHAIIDPSSAWKEAEELFSPELDSGLSKTQVLFFILCDDTVSAESLNLQNKTSSGNNGSENNIISAQCKDHSDCANTGLGGDCCPSATGIFLSCCNVSDENVDTSKENNGTSGSDLCATNLACANAHLVGKCCPTPDGFFLSCCD